MRPDEAMDRKGLPPYHRASFIDKQVSCLWHPLASPPKCVTDHRRAGNILFCCFRSSVSFSFSSCWAPALGFLSLSCRSSTEVPASGPRLATLKAVCIVLLREELGASQRQWGKGHSARTHLLPGVHSVLTPFGDACRILISWLKSPRCVLRLVFYIRCPARKMIQSTSHKARESCRAPKGGPSI